jgi:diguanylate cyclase (GGDEF)-like protein
VSARTVIASYGAGMAGLIAAALVVPAWSTAWGAVAWAAVGVAATAAIAVGVVRHRSSRFWPWALLAGSILVSTCADVLYLRSQAGQRSDMGLANGLYLLAFVIGAAALLRFGRSGSRGVEQTGLLDALTVTMVLLLLVWITAISPKGLGAWSMADPALVAYVIGDALLLATAVRLLGARRRTPAAVLLLVGTLIALAADTANGVASVPPAPPLADAMNASWLLFYACWGAAALHPSMTRLTTPEVMGERELTLRRLWMVALIALVPPGILFIEAVRGEIRDGIVLAVAAAALFLLSLGRIAATANGHRRSLVYRERHDTLTGLANRAYLMDRVGAAVASVAAGRSAGPVAVILLDLDDFRAINDAVGHSVADEVLVAVARRLVRHLGRHDVVARAGGDEFAILVGEAPPGRDISVLASRVAAVTSEPVTAAGRSIAVTACLGLTMMARADMGDAEPVRVAHDLLRQADLALQAAKAAGPGQSCRYESEQHERIMERMRLREALKRAVDQGSFQLQYQPIVALDTSETVGFEALVRWEHPTRGLVAPSEFIALAEETGLIDPIGDLVLRTAVADAVGWSRVSSVEAYVSVNVSARQFRTPGFSERVERVISTAGLRPSLLMLEITESVLMREEDHVWAELATLRDNGIRLAIDDFGTGFSSLSYLEQTPIDVIKIDRSFVGTLVESGRQRTVVEGIVRMAEKLGLQIVAEGVEHAAQRDLLAEMRCPYGQGYLYAVPLSNAEATNWLAYPPTPAAAQPAADPPHPPAPRAPAEEQAEPVSPELC